MTLSKEKSEEIVRDLIAKSFRRFKQEIEGENEEFLDRVLRQFRAKVSRHIWRTAQKWSKWDSGGPVLMPDHTRIYYRKGNTEVVLQEFPPQVRLLKFRGALVNRKNSTEQIAAAKMSSVHHFSLALPYVVFLFKFVNGTFIEVKCAFCDRPLKRLEERPLRPYLSNIDSNLSVCMGSSFDRSQLQPGQLTQQMALVLDHFWHSAFSDEWSTHFWQTRSQNDPRLETFQAWQKATEENPLFVVEDVHWLQHQEEAFGDILVRMLEDDKLNNDLHEEIYQGLVDEFFEDLQKSYAENVDAISVSDNLVVSLAEDLRTQLLRS